MVLEAFAALVGFLALAYSGLLKFIQNKLVDKKEMEGIQAEAKRLNEEMDRAQKAGNQKKVDELMAKQLEHLQKMNGAMLNSMKPMFVIVLVFAAFMWVVGMLDPYVKDDITLNMTDDGLGCDRAAGDGVFSACYTLAGENFGKWTVHAKMFEGSSEMGSNETYFLLNAQNASDTYVEPGKGEKLELGTDKREYAPGETVAITGVPANMTQGSEFIIRLSEPRPLRIDHMSATLSNGTYFSVELPIAIPLLNVKTIYQPYWWFILVSLIGNLGISFVMGRMKKKEGKKK
jgi:hypothetical protein